MYIIADKAFKKIFEKIFSFKYLLLEIVLLYVFIEIISHIPYTLNILPITKFTESDLFLLFTPFILLIFLGIIIRVAKQKLHTAD